MSRRDDLQFDPRLADWLEDGPYRAPARALEVVLASYPSIKQRRAERMPWRNPLMTNAMKFGLAAAAVVAATAGGLFLLSPQSDPPVGGPTSSPPTVSTPSPGPAVAPSSEPSSGPSRTPPANRTSFESPQYGYTVLHPTAYGTKPATEPWIDGFVGPEEPWVDRFFAPFGGAAFVGIAVQPIPDGMTPEAWMAAYEATVAERGCSVPIATWTDATVGDAPAREAEFDCSGTPALERIWVEGGRGWVITGEPAVVELLLASLRTG